MPRTWAEVNLDCVEHNIKEIRKITNPKSKIFAVVKADAYGHGFWEVSKTLLENGADGLCVACIDEAKQLRKKSISADILVLGHIPSESVEDIIRFNIMPTIFDDSIIYKLSSAAKTLNKVVKVHIKIDTGMNRIGFLCDSQNIDNTIQSILNISKLPGIHIEGIFSHLATADSDKSYAIHQFDTFIKVCGIIESLGLNIPIKHICNSAGIISFPQMHMDMVRPGIILYGLYPSPSVDKSKLYLKPSMELKTIITNIKDIEKKSSVGYGRAFTASEKTRVATLPIGYADGYSYLLSGKARVITNNAIVPVIGNICMDQCMINVTNVNNISTGDEVVIFGKKNGLSVSVEDIAGIMGTINYEVLCVIGKRVPRVYVKHREVVEILNYLL